MSVRNSLESIFSHLYAEPAGEDEAAADDAAAAPGEAPAEVPPAEEGEAPAPAPAPSPSTVIFGVPDIEREPDRYAVVEIEKIDRELESRVIGVHDAEAHLAFARERAAKKDVAVRAAPRVPCQLLPEPLRPVSHAAAASMQPTPLPQHAQPRLASRARRRSSSPRTSSTVASSARRGCRRWSRSWR